MRGSSRAVTAVVVALVMAITAGAQGFACPRPAAAAAAAPRTDSCNPNTDTMSPHVAARHLMAGRYKLGHHPLVHLGRNPTWSEDPLRDRNWRERLHMLRFLMALMIEWQDTRDVRYRDRAFALLRSWIARNPRSHPASVYSWGDHSTAWRTMTMVCIARMVPRQAWLVRAISTHGAVLADPRFYVGRSNHALNQAIGLLDAGCYLHRRGWQRLAAERIGRLVTRSVSSQGVSNEQAIRYDLYDYMRFTAARDHLRACGHPVPRDFERVLRMPTFLAHATRPDGRYETLGDTTDRFATAIAGTPAEFAATRGGRGRKPSSEIAVFQRGYVFGRTGWGEHRRYRDEAFFSLSFGSGMQIHGHDDGGAVTLYALGGQLLVDPGYGDYNVSRWSAYFGSRRAHNTVIASGVRSRTSQPTILERRSITGRSAELVVRAQPYPGAVLRRRVIFSRWSGYLVVEDTIRSSVARTWRQLWHLRERTRPMTRGRRTWTRAGSSDLLIQQLVRTGTTRLVEGERDPIHGWISRAYGQRTPAPVVERVMRGRSVRYVTVLAPFAGGDVPKVSDVRLTPRGFSFVIDADGRRERVRATGGGASITDVRWAPIGEVSSVGPERS